MGSIETECTCNSIPYKIEAVTPPVLHSEGPHWDPKTKSLYFVDTFNATAYRLKPENKDHEITKFELDQRNSIGVIIPIKNEENEFVVTADRYIYKLHWHTNTDNKGTLNEIHFVDHDKPNNQFNDGKADSRGRLWTGTLTRNDDLSVSSNGGNLYEFDLAKKVRTHIENVSISNGMAWSKDNKKYFFTDSATRKILVYDFDENSGRLGNHKILFDLEEHPNLKGIPDGFSIDEKDDLWVALFGGHGIIHISGKSGKLLNYLKLPTTYCTSTCFGGPNQDILYVTTSKLKLKKEELEKEPQAGSVFAVTNIGVKGPAPFECVLHGEKESSAN